MNEETRVAIKRGGEYEAAFGALSLIEGDIRASLGVRKPNQIFLKPNWVNHRPDWLSITKLSTLRAIIDFFNKLGSYEILVADAAPDKRFLELADYTPLEREYGNVRVADLADMESAPVFKALTVGGEKVVRYYYPPLGSQFFVSVAKMKTHNVFANTLSLKNVGVGCAVNEDKKIFHVMSGSEDEKAKAEYDRLPVMMNYNMYCAARAMYPDLSLIDGVVAMEGNGPVEGQPVAVGAAFASTDPLSADAVVTDAMGFSCEEIPFLNALKKDREPEIRAVGDEFKSVKKNFKSNPFYCRPRNVDEALRELIVSRGVPPYQAFRSIGK